MYPQRDGERDPRACAVPGMSSLGTLGLPTRSPKADTPALPAPQWSLGHWGSWGGSWGLPGPFLSPKGRRETPGSPGRPHFWGHSATKRNHFQRRPAGPWVCGANQGRPVVAGGVGLGHPGRSFPAPSPARGAGRPRNSRVASEGTAGSTRSLTCPPSSPGLPSRGWRRGFGGRHLPAQAGEAPRPGLGALDSHPCPPCRSQFGQ